MEYSFVVSSIAAMAKSTRNQILEKIKRGDNPLEFLAQDVPDVKRRLQRVT